MSDAFPALTEASALACVRHATCTPHPDSRVGVELEWLVYDGRDRARVVHPDTVRPCLGAGYDGTLTFEPGGQIEVSSRPHAFAAGAIAATARDLEVLRSRLHAAGFELDGSGLDRWREPVRVLSLPRYSAMERYFRHSGSAAASTTMMCSTASVQVNVALGADPADVARRWRLAHRLGPVLAAAFANSPLTPAGPSGWRSTRLAAWFALDPSRTSPLPGEVPPGASWPEYALDARVMLMRRGDDECEAQVEPLTFREWLTRGDELGHPTRSDLAYHLTTLFPPVRPRGWLELRMIDALAQAWWPVPVLVVAALLDDPGSEAAILEATAATDGRWVDAARAGLSDPDFAAAAEACFSLAVAGSAAAPAADLVSSYAERYVRCARTPADDLLDRWAGVDHAAEALR